VCVWGGGGHSVGGGAGRWDVRIISDGFEISVKAANLKREEQDRERERLEQESRKFEPSTKGWGSQEEKTKK
jgi:hypothetical protein